MRDGWLPLGLVLLVGAVSLGACGQAFQLTGATGAGGGSSTVTTGPGGPGGGGGGDTSASSAGGASSSSVGSSTSTGMINGTPCVKDSECKTAYDTLCSAGVCNQNHCAFKVLQNDGPSLSQLYGDCHTAVCAKPKLVSMANDKDVYDDGNECTDDICKSGAPQNNSKAGMSCGVNGVCNDTGACVQCTTDNVSKCEGGKQQCISGYCSAETCTNLNKDNGETDLDCGGTECAPCGVGLHCAFASDCLSKVCALPFPNAPEKVCLLAICADNVKNNDETDIDCGGASCGAGNKCPEMKHCAKATDCKSGVCQVGVCQKPSCNDGVMNGMETGIDCGAQTCTFTKCPGT